VKYQFCLQLSAAGFKKEYYYYHHQSNQSFCTMLHITYKSEIQFIKKRNISYDILTLNSKKNREVVSILIFKRIFDTRANSKLIPEKAPAMNFFNYLWSFYDVSVKISKASNNESLTIVVQFLIHKIGLFSRDTKLFQTKNQTDRDYRGIFLNRVTVPAWVQKQDEYIFHLIKILL
jgi:hypothetical protein